MTATQGLNFLPTTAILVLCVIMVLATAGLCWIAWVRSGYRRGTGLLELLRLGIVVLVAITLCQPEWVEVRPVQESSTLAVLVDESKSMQTRDVLDSTGDARSRSESIAALAVAEAWGEPQAPAQDKEGIDLQVVVEPFSSDLEAPHQGTDLNGGLERVLDSYAHLRGVVVLSDGDWNTGGSPTLAATRYRLAGVPIFGVGAGSPVSLPDLELVRMDAPTFGVAGKPLRIPYQVRSTLAREVERQVVLKVDGAPVATDVLGVPPMGDAQGDVVWFPGQTGDFTLELSVSASEDETFEDNNRRSGPISIRQEELQVLVIESYPRWEYRYLRNALERDPGVEVSCLLLHPELPGVGGGRSYLEAFPDEAELSRYDVVFVGDVGLGPKQLQVADVLLLKQLVSAQAAGLVFLPGRYGFQESLVASPLGELLPVVLDPGRSTGVGSSTAGHLTLTQSGRQSLLTQLEESTAANTEIWRKLPGFHWYAGVARAKVGAEVLAVHERDRVEGGRVPLLVTKAFGTGKVLFLGTDSAWRWREGVEDRYHYRFWAQVTRWMAYRRQMAEGQAMRLFYSPDRPEVRDVVTLNANVLDALGGPLANGTVVIQANSPAGRTSTVRLEPGTEDAWGLFVGSFRPTESGIYRLVATCAETGASVQAELSVQGQEVERIGRLARLDVLEEVSSITRGRTVAVAQVAEVLEDLRALPEPEPQVLRTKLWAHPVWTALLILLLAAFWTGRKFIGAV